MRKGRTITTAHRWVGLVIGLYMAVLGLSGAGLVLAPQFSAWEHGVPATPRERADAAYASPDIWVAKARARYGDLPPMDSFNGPLATPMRIAAPTMQYSTMGPGGFTTGVVAVDPYTGEPMKHFTAQDSWSLLPLSLHMSFFLPFTIMWTVLAVLAWLLLGLVLSGMASWWPRSGRLRQSLTLAKPVNPAALQRAHAALGAWSALALLALAITGLLMVDKPLAARVVAALGSEGPPRLAPTSCDIRLMPGQALDRAKALAPGFEMAALEAPSSPGAPFVVRLRNKGSVDPVRGTREFAVSSCAPFTVVERGAQASAGNWLADHLVAIHGGRLLGRAGELLVVLAGVLLAVLPATGIAAWTWRRSRRAGSQQPDERAEQS